MTWNWQQRDWPHFSWDAARLTKAESQFLLGGGVLVGAVRHLDEGERDDLAVEAMSDEAVTTSAIEGEVVDRASVQSSIRKQLGLEAISNRARPPERGIGEVMVDLYRDFAAPLSDETLFRWHRMIVLGRHDLRDVGRYRTHAGPMRVVSGRVYEPTVHFEAPPSGTVPGHMDGFVEWFNRTAPDGRTPLPALTRSGIAHLYFESIHPFEDGNGRVGRAIAEKALAQGLGRPSLTGLATTILARRRQYYAALAAASRAMQATEWLAWFGGVGLEAQRRTLAQVEFLLDKARLLERLRGRLNERQERVLVRVLREGPEGFRGGLSSGKYVRIAKTSAATARRDLAELVTLGAVTRTGEKRGTRYHPAIPLRPTPTVSIDAHGEVVTHEG